MSSEKRSISNRKEDMNSLHGKKLLVLAGNSVHEKIVRAAKDLGVYTIVTDYLPVEQSPAKLVADEYWMLSTGDTDAVVEKCRQEKVDGVLTFCIDTVQFHYLEICEKLGVPCYGTRRQFEVMTNKRLFKDYCKAHGVGTIPEYTLDDIDNDRAEFPVLIKPSDSRGSRGQTVCHDKSEISKAIAFAQSESKDGGYLIERYMQGTQDMSFAYIVISGEPYLIKIGDRYLGKPEDNLDKQQMATLLPSHFADDYRKEVEWKVIEMIKSLGMSFGPIFMQGFFDKGQVYMYDPGLRFPGSDFDIVLKAATGFDSMTSFVRFALTGDPGSHEGNPSGVFDYGGKYCLLLSVSARPGIIGRLGGMEKIKSLPSVFSAFYYHHEGDEIPASGDIRQRVAEFCCLLPDRDSVSRLISMVYETLIIEDEQGNSMIVSKVETLY